MDAHAWVEAWDEQQSRWVTVEATAQGSDAIAAAEEQAGRNGGRINISLTQFLHALYEYGLFGALSWLLMSRGGAILLLALAAALVPTLWWVLSRRRRSRSSPGLGSRWRADPSIATLHRMLAGMDRRLRAAGIRRPLSETLHAFAERLGAADSGGPNGLRKWDGVSDWYVQYANLRYGRAIRAEHIETLRQHAGRVKQSL